MRTRLGADIESEFHLVECLLQIGRRQLANHGRAFVANDAGLIPRGGADQTTATLRLAEIRMGKHCVYEGSVFNPRAETDPAITGCREWRNVALSECTPGIVAVADWYASATSRGADRSDVRIRKHSCPTVYRVLGRSDRS